MKRLINLLTCLLLVMISQEVFAQSTISGTITDDAGDPRSLARVFPTLSVSQEVRSR